MDDSGSKKEVVIIMEELRNDNLSGQTGTEEPVIEQRPSTKYGRTAYQQQQEAVDRSWQEQYSKSQYSQTQYHQTQQEPYRTYSSSYEQTKPNIKNIYANIAMILVAVCQIVVCIANIMAAEAYSMGNTLDEVMDAIIVISSRPAYVVLITINDIAFWAMAALLLIDIMQFRRAGIKTRGAILFAIFLRPAYFIWRAHLLKEKKIVPMIYAVVLYLIFIAQYVVLFQGAIDMVMRTM